MAQCSLEQHEDGMAIIFPFVAPRLTRFTSHFPPVIWKWREKNSSNYETSSLLLSLLCFLCFAEWTSHSCYSCGGTRHPPDALNLSLGQCGQCVAGIMSDWLQEDTKQKDTFNDASLMGSNFHNKGTIVGSIVALTKRDNFTVVTNINRQEGWFALPLWPWAT